jgi:nucleoside-diphosphate-sugar epimerase
MSRITVVGASGYIGAPLLQQAGPSAKGTSSSGDGGLLSLDLERPSTFDYTQIDAGEVVLLLAAISSPDACTRQRDWVHSINVKGTSAFIEGALARGARVVFFSTDAVYGEQTSPFDETMEPSPVGAYAEMKFAVEQRFLGEASFRTVRLSYVFSRWDSFTRYLFGCAEDGVAAEVFPSFARSVVSRDDVISAALSIARNWDDVSEQTINFGGPDILSRAEFAGILRANILPDLQIVEKDPDEAFFLSRPRKIAMQSPIMDRLLGRPRLSLEAAASSFAR